MILIFNGFLYPGRSAEHKNHNCKLLLTGFCLFYKGYILFWAYPLIHQGQWLNFFNVVKESDSQKKFRDTEPLLPFPSICDWKKCESFNGKQVNEHNTQYIWMHLTMLLSIYWPNVFLVLYILKPFLDKTLLWRLASVACLLCHNIMLSNNLKTQDISWTWH